MTISDMVREIGDLPVWILVLILFSRQVLILAAAAMEWLIGALGLLGERAYRMGRCGHTPKSIQQETDNAR